MATLRMAAGSVLGTVTETASAVNDVVKSVSSGARMLNEFVDHQRVTAAENRALDTKFSDETRLQTKMLEIAQLREKSREYMSSNPSRQADCQEILNELKVALADARSKAATPA